MFSKRKKNYRVFVVTALIIALCVLIAVILWPTEPSDTNNLPNTPTSKDTPVNEPDDSEDQESRTPTSSHTYYMVMKNGQVISVYFITETGEKMKLEDTEILYDLLPLEDQEKFDKGIVIENQEALYSLLQDFEG